MKQRSLIALLAASLLIAAGAIALGLRDRVGRLDGATLEQWGEVPVMIDAPASAQLWIDGEPVERAEGVGTVIVQLSEGEHALRASQDQAEGDFTFSVIAGAPPVIHVAVGSDGVTFDAK